MPPIVLAIACLAIVTLCYAALCAGSPFGTCRTCRGFGFHTIQDRRGRLKRGKTCHHCRGQGYRIRTGRHLYNLAHRLYRDGTDTPTTPARPAPRRPARKG